jgi:tRNA dimethylallyltransferase
VGETTKFIIVVNGPTASGKTRCAIEIAKAFGGEIISADSRQFYREISIGTAKPSAAEQAEVPHHFIDSLSIQEPYTAGDFERDGLKKIDEIYSRGNVPVVCGGSGLYIKALLHGLDSTPVKENLRAEIEAIFKKDGITALQEEVKRLDPVYYAKMDSKNPMRLIRSLELIRTTGKPMSEILTGTGKKRDFAPVKIGIDLSREVLYERINQRVDEMMAAGLEAEARAVHEFKEVQALQTVGYKEMFEYFEGKTGLEDAIHMIKQNSRRYAKRQLTWLRKETDILWFHPENQADIHTVISQKTGLKHLQ